MPGGFSDNVTRTRLVKQASPTPATSSATVPQAAPLKSLFFITAGGWIAMVIRLKLRVGWGRREGGTLLSRQLRVDGVDDGGGGGSVVVAPAAAAVDIITCCC